MDLTGRQLRERRCFAVDSKDLECRGLELHESARIGQHLVCAIDAQLLACRELVDSGITRCLGGSECLLQRHDLRIRGIRTQLLLVGFGLRVHHRRESFLQFVHNSLLISVV